MLMDINIYNKGKSYPWKLKVTNTLVLYFLLQTIVIIKDRDL
jgi:hypothetical protein